MCLFCTVRVGDCGGERERETSVIATLGETVSCNEEERLAGECRVSVGAGDKSAMKIYLRRRLIVLLLNRQVTGAQSQGPSIGLFMEPCACQLRLGEL